MLLSTSFLVQAQEFGISLSYQYMEAQEWNKATQIYNFSRPFLENKQPLLKSGWRLDTYYLFEENKTLAWGPSFSTSYHRSSANNNNFDIDINAFLLDLGIKFQYRPLINSDKPLHISFTPSFSGFLLQRKLNGEIIEIEEEEDVSKLRSVGLGIGLNTEIGYDISLGGKCYLSPVIGLSYNPFYKNVGGSRDEWIFNEASAGDFANSTSIWRVYGGLRFKIR